MQLAQSLKLEPHTFVSLTGTTTTQDSDAIPASGLETIHYLAPSIPAAGGSSSASCEAYIDKGLLTFFFPDTEQGLHVGPLHVKRPIYLHKLEAFFSLVKSWLSNAQAAFQEQPYCKHKMLYLSTDLNSLSGQNSRWFLATTCCARRAYSCLGWLHPGASNVWPGQSCHTQSGE